MIPPHIHEEILRRGTDAQKAAARAQIRAANALRIKRALATMGHSPARQTPGTRTRETYDAQGTEQRPQVPSRTETSPPDPVNPEVNEAHDGAGETWRLLQERFGRDSLDGEGMVLVSTVDWDAMDNAYWDGEAMTYGRGQLFNRFTADPTVCGHELGHGFIQFAWGAVYYGEPGALNEHGADVLGSLVEQHAKGQDVHAADWLIGAELLGPTIQGRALRDMLHPGTAYDDPLIGTDPQPDHYSRRYRGGQDNGGVHINSGIGNRAYVLAARALGGSAWEHVGKLWLQYVMPGASAMITYPEFASRCVAMAREHFTPAVAAAVRHGWREVGLDVDAAPAPPEEIPSDCPPEVKAALVKLVASPEGRLLVGWGRKLAART